MSRVSEVVARQLQSGVLQQCRYGELVVYLHLDAMLANGAKSLTVRRIARGANVSNATAYRAVKSLVRRRRIKVEPTKGIAPKGYSGMYSLLDSVARV